MPPTADRRALIAGIGGLAAGALLAGSRSAHAGPLTPMVFPVAPTGKTTQEIFDKVAAVEPRIAINATNTPGDSDASPSLFKITQPGSYYLTGNISLVNAKNAIEITSSGVWLDLNGFSISGFGGLAGIIVTNTAAERIAIRNGTISNFLNGGIVANVPDVSVDRVSVTTCGTVGIRAGLRARITDCSVVNCYTNAIGIAVSQSSVIRYCVVSGNASSGITSAEGCLISKCTAHANTAGGIKAFGPTTITNCRVYENAGAGIDAGRFSLVSNCSSNENADYGIVTDTGTSVVNCSTLYNAGAGIAAAVDCVVADCNVGGSKLDGIFAQSNCIIRGNSCHGNGSGGDGAGIRVSGGNNRIESNNCIGADRGIDVDGPGNIIIKNTCSGNTTNWTIVAGNSFLIVQATLTASNFSGNAGGGGQGTTDPNANFTY